MPRRKQRCVSHRRAHAPAVAGRRKSHSALAAGDVRNESGCAWSKARPRPVAGQCDGSLSPQGSSAVIPRRPMQGLFCVRRPTAPSSSTTPDDSIRPHQHGRGASLAWRKANTGHHHLLIDAPLPLLDQPIPARLQSFALRSAGQTEAQITLTPRYPYASTDPRRRKPRAARSRRLLQAYQGHGERERSCRTAVGSSA